MTAAAFHQWPGPGRACSIVSMLSVTACHRVLGQATWHSMLMELQARKRAAAGAGTAAAAADEQQQGCWLGGNSNVPSTAACMSAETAVASISDSRNKTCSATQIQHLNSVVCITGRYLKCAAADATRALLPLERTHAAWPQPKQQPAKTNLSV